MSAGLASTARELTASERLRAETAEAHAALEAELDLLHDLTRTRLVAVLRRFRAFHAGWEPAAAEALAEPTLFDPRRRLPALDADLAVLGAAPDAEVWTAPAWLRDPDAAWGSLYVLEGSTLGGQVIGRAVRAAGVEGLRYFDGRGAQAGPMWRALRARLDARGARAATTAGAVATFDALRLWMRGAHPSRDGGSSL